MRILMCCKRCRCTCDLNIHGHKIGRRTKTTSTKNVIQEKEKSKRYSEKQKTTNSKPWQRIWGQVMSLENQETCLGKPLSWDGVLLRAGGFWGRFARMRIRMMNDFQ